MFNVRLGDASSDVRLCIGNQHISAIELTSRKQGQMSSILHL